MFIIAKYGYPRNNNKKKWSSATFSFPLFPNPTHKKVRQGIFVNPQKQIPHKWNIWATCNVLSSTKWSNCFCRYLVHGAHFFYG